MTLLVLDNIYRFAFKGTWTNGQPWVNVLAAEVKSDGVQTSRPEVWEQYKTRIVALFQDDLLGIFPNNYTFVGMDFVDLDSADGETGTIPAQAGHPTAGTQSPLQAPPNNCMLVRKIARDRTRGRRNGRWYLPGVAEGNVDEDGVVLSSAITAYNTALANFFAHANDDGGGNLPIGSTVNLGIVSNPTKAGLPAKFMIMDSFATQARIASQRRHLTWD